MMGQDVVCQVTVKATSPTAALPALRGAPLELVRSHLHLSDSAETHVYISTHAYMWLNCFLCIHVRHCVWKGIHKADSHRQIPPLCRMPWHYKQASWIRQGSVIVSRGKRDVRLVQWVFNWLIVSLWLSMIIKTPPPPPPPPSSVTLVALQKTVAELLLLVLQLKRSGWPENWELLFWKLKNLVSSLCDFKLCALGNVLSKRRMQETLTLIFN